MKAPVGLLSDRTVLRSKMEGLCPDKFQFVAPIIFLFLIKTGYRSVCGRAGIPFLSIILLFLSAAARRAAVEGAVIAEGRAT